MRETINGLEQKVEVFIQDSGPFTVSVEEAKRLHDAGALDPAVEGVLLKAPEAYADVAAANKKMSEGKYPKRGFAYSPPRGQVWNPARDYPRNAPCLCGSGKKYKKCHLPGMADCVEPAEALSISAKMKEVLG